MSFFESIVLGEQFSIVFKSIADDYGSTPPYKPGSNITLKCKASEGMEKCKWSHKSKSYCLFEWTFLNGNKETERCSKSLKNRVKFVGNDENCFIRLQNISYHDHGEWKCEVQEYITGPLDGLLAETDTATLALEVDYPNRKGKHIVETSDPKLNFDLIH